MDPKLLSAMFVGAFFFVVVVYVAIRIFYKKVGPDAALIVYGRRQLFGPQIKDTKGEVTSIRIVRGGGTFVFPAWEAAEVLSLRMMTLDIDLRHVYTAQGIPINVKAVAQVKIKGETEQIIKAAEGFLGMPDHQIKATIQETVAGHLRGIIGTLTLEELYQDQKRFLERVSAEAQHDLDGMGFEVKSFVFQEIQDDQGYLNSLGAPKIQEALKNARIATAESDRAAKIEEESARQQREKKRLAVDAEIAESGRELALKQAENKRQIDVAQAQAQKAGEMEAKVQDISIAEKEVARQKLELNATVRERADAKKYEAERLADAEKYTIEQQAIADRKRREEAAMAMKIEGLARAEAESAQRRQIGLAEAEAIRAKGEAEAEARRKLAEAFKLYSDAGLSIEALKVLPELAAAIAEPLSRAGNATIISHGGAEGSGTGAARLSEDVVKVMTQLGPLMKQVAGINLDSFLQDVTKLPGAVVSALDKRPSKPEKEG